MTDITGLNADQKELCLTQTAILHSVCKGETPVLFGIAQHRNMTIHLAKNATPEFAEMLSGLWMLALAPHIVADAHKKMAVAVPPRPEKRRYNRSGPKNG